MRTHYIVGGLLIRIETSKDVKKDFIITLNDYKSDHNFVTFGADMEDLVKIKGIIEDLIFKSEVD